jgi:hypothetical protein
MPAFTKTGRVSVNTPPGTRCQKGFRRGQSKKDGPSGKNACVEEKNAAPKRQKFTGKFVPAATPTGFVQGLGMVEEI